MKSQATNVGRAATLVLAYFSLALIGGWVLKRHIVITTTLAKLPTLSLLSMNAIFVFMGVPLSAVGDLLLLKRVGVSYLFFWPFFVAFASCAQIYFFRTAAKRSWISPLTQRLQRRSNAVIQGKMKQSMLVLLIRAVPLMPFMVGSFLIAMLPRVSHRTIVGFSVLGCYLYYSYFGAGFLFGSAAGAS